MASVGRLLPEIIYLRTEDAGSLLFRQLDFASITHTVPGLEERPSRRAWCGDAGCGSLWLAF